MKYKSINEFKQIVGPVALHSKIKQMKRYRHHYDTSCYSHCFRVAYCCYVVAKKLNLDYVTLTRAAMMHDFFLYDWRQGARHEVKGFFNKHAFVHGKIAYRKANKIFGISKKERDIIENHMWPVTLKLPKYKETYVISLVDKYCATVESINCIKRRKKYSAMAEKLKTISNKGNGRIVMP